MATTLRMNREATKKQRKEDLLKLSKDHQKALYNELNLSSIRVVEFGKNMAIIGGVLYVGYTVLDRFLDSSLKSERKSKAPNKYETLNKMILPILAMALQQGSTILLKRARAMLVEYLEKKGSDDV